VTDTAPRLRARFASIVAVQGIVWLALALPAHAEADALAAARAYRTENAARILREFADLLRIPNTGDDPSGLLRNAEAIRGMLAARGVAAELLRVGDAPPVVFGRLDADGAARTLGIYVHYDGQPVDAPSWTHPPFEPVLYSRAIEDGGRPRPFPQPGEAVDPEWRIYARSSGDDKAPLAALAAALDGLSAGGVARTSNLVFLFEGEEERGSEHLGSVLEAYADRFAVVDLWLICDGPVHPSRRPQLVFGVRGYSGLDITVYGAERALHSGHYGNWAPNPAFMLAELLAGMRDEDGQVRIEGFYDTVVPLDEAGRIALERLPAVDDDLRRELGLRRTEGGNAPLASRILLPSLNVRGLASATVGPTARNIVPARAEASIDIRLVPGNDPEHMLDLVEEYVRSRGYFVVRQDPDHATRLAHERIARVDRRPGYPAVRTSMDLPAVRQVIAAVREVAGDDLVLVPGLGGSLPLHEFVTRSGAPLVITPIANHDDNQHAPDENLRLANLWYGADVFAALLAMP